jgi:hypothetical protein
LPAVTGSGVSAFVTCMSEEVATVVVAVSLLFAPFGSVVAEVRVAVFESTVPPGTDGITVTTSVKKSTVTPKLVFVQETVPLAPTDGVVHDHGPVVERDTKVVPVGSVSEKLALAALLGPLFVRVSW